MSFTPLPTSHASTLQARTLQAVVATPLALLFAAIAVGLLGVRPADAQGTAPASQVTLGPPPDSTALLRLVLRDGTILMGTPVSSDSLTWSVRARSGTFAVSRAEVLAAEWVSPASLHEGEYWPPTPTGTRLLFGPTGRTLAHGNGYVSDQYLFLLNGAYGVTDRLTMGVGMSVLPSGDFLRNNLYYLMPKYALVRRDDFNASLGAFIGTMPAANTSSFNSFGIAYGVATVGPSDRSVTAGLGYGFVNGHFAEKPAVLLGTELRLSRRVAFISENYVMPGTDGVILSYGLRLIGDRLSTDLAFINHTSSGVFPGFPWLGFTYRF